MPINCDSLTTSFSSLCVRLYMQTKNPGHFTAWSSCLLSHEMYRKTQLAAGTAPEGLTQRMKGGMASTVTVGDGESLDSWAERTQTVIGGVRRGNEWGQAGNLGEQGI